MNLIQILNGAVVFIGIPTIAGVLIYIGKKLQTLDSVECDLKDNIRPDLKEVRERFFSLEGRLAGTFGTASPISLKPRGEEILEKSGLKKYINDNRTLLLDKFRLNHILNNQYDIQAQAFKLFDEFDFGEFDASLKKASFDYGMDTATIRRIGGIYFRDMALLQAGFKPEDLDGPKTA